MNPYLSTFLLYYPLTMGILWSVGGLLYYIKREKKQVKEKETLFIYKEKSMENPFVSILIPAHNEEETIYETVIQSVMVNYQNYEVIVINDGSKDRTEEILYELNQTYKKLRIINIKENKGKAYALKQGTIAAKGEIIITIDSDAILDKEAIRYLLPHFNSKNHTERVGAVTGNPRIRNRTTLLSKIQIAEYPTIIGLIKRTQRLIGKVMTISGVFTAFRKKALEEIGYWDENLITEDIGITWKLQKAGWDVRYETNAICWMLVPETIKGLWNQRIRWTQGGIEVLLRHYDVLYKKETRLMVPIYLEQILSIIWSYLWFINILLLLYGDFYLKEKVANLFNTGEYIAVIGLLQFFVALKIEKKYEKNISKYMVWTIWYPLLYWQLNALLVVFAFPRAIKIVTKKENKRARWKSPDRGYKRREERNGY